MTCEAFIDQLPDLKLAKVQGDKWCIVYFSKSQDGYRTSLNLDSGDALLVIQKLIDEYGIDPEVLASMRQSQKPFITSLNERPNTGLN